MAAETAMLIDDDVGGGRPGNAPATWVIWSRNCPSLVRRHVSPETAIKSPRTKAPTDFYLL